MVHCVQVEPTARDGTFDELSFALVLVHALDQRWTGTLLVEPPFDMLHVLELDRGLVSRVLVPDVYALLGAILVEAGVIMDSELELALEQDTLLGEALAEQKLLDGRTLERALVLQVLKRLVRVFDFPGETAWSFFPDLDAFKGMPDGVRVDTLRILWAGFSAHGEAERFLEAALARIGESRFQLRSDAQVARFGFTGDASRLVGLVNAERVSLGELLEYGVAPEEVCKIIVYLLTITRYLDFSPVGEDVDAVAAVSTTDSSDGETPGSSPSSSDEIRQSRRVARIQLRRVALRGPAAPDPPGSGEARDFAARSLGELETLRDQTIPSVLSRELLAAELKSRLARLDGESPFSLLGVEPMALRPLNEARADELLWEAYERATKRWHPDNCPEQAPELREGMQRLHDAICDAYVVVADPDTRSAELFRVLGGIDEVSSSGSRPRSDMPSPRRHDTDPDHAPRTTMPSQRAASDVPPVALPTLGAIPSVQVPVSPRANSQGPASGAPDTEPEAGLEAPAHSSKRLVEELTPSQLHERALVALSQQQISEALKYCLLACQQAPDEADYVATGVWIRAAMPKPDLKVLILDLDDLLLGHEEHVTGRYYRGVLRRRLGNDSAARQDFERVLSLDPDHAGARRQLSELSRVSEA